MVCRAMELRRAGYAVVFVILLCALAIGGSEGKRKTQKAFSSNGDDEICQENKNMEEIIWIHCREAIIDGKSAVQSLDLYSHQRTISELKSLFLAKKDVHGEILVLPAHVKQQFIDCLREKSNHFHAPKTKFSSRLLVKHAKLFFNRQHPPKRYLTSESHQPISQKQMPVENPYPDLWFPIKNSENSLTLVNKIESSIKLESKKHEDNHIITIAIAATASVTFCITALLICCCINGSNRKIGPRDVRDDRPLLNLSSGDFSAGSSQKSFNLDKTDNVGVNSGKFAGNNFATSSENYDFSHAVAATSSEATGSTPFPPLKPPPGRTVASTSKPSPPAGSSAAQTPKPSPPPPPPVPKPPPPPPSKAARPPPAPPKPCKTKAPPPRPAHKSSGSGDGSDVDSESGSSKTKLKPFFWDKVSANTEQAMVWHEISAGSFQFNEEMIESLFGYNAENNKNVRKKGSPALEPAFQYIKIIDPKKAQNLSILLRALDVTTEEVCDALQEGNELPLELLQTLLKMAPTTDEELKLRLYTGDLSQLGPAERFLKALVDIPFSFKRLESLLFMCSYQEEVTNMKESYGILEVASNKLRNSRLFLKLLEAVLKTGNRMNDGTYRGSAQAFKLDTLLKVADVKGTDGRTTLLHFVVKEIIRSEGIKAVRRAKASQSMSSLRTEDFTDDIPEESVEQYHNLGLQVVSGLSDELEDVKKAGAIDSDGLTATVLRLNNSLNKTRNFLNVEMKNLDEDSEFVSTLASFVEHAEEDITKLVDEDKRIMALVKSTADYFHGNAGKEEGLRLFAIVRDFLRILEKVCREVRESAAHQTRVTNCKKEAPTEKEITTGKEAPTIKEIPILKEAQTEKEDPTRTESSENRQPLSDVRQRLFPAIAERRMEDSSDDESSSESSP